MISGLSAVLSIAKPKCKSLSMGDCKRDKDHAVLQNQPNKKGKHPPGAQARPKNVLHSSSICIYGSWYVRHPRAAIYNKLAIYSGGRMKKLLRSPVPRAQSLLSQQNRYTRSAGLPQSEPVSRKAKYSDRDIGHAPALPGMPSY